MSTSIPNTTVLSTFNFSGLAHWHSWLSISITWHCFNSSSFPNFALNSYHNVKSSLYTDLKLGATDVVRGFLLGFFHHYRQLLVRLKFSLNCTTNLVRGYQGPFPNHSDQFSDSPIGKNMGCKYQWEIQTSLVILLYQKRKSNCSKRDMSCFCWTFSWEGQLWLIFFFFFSF